MVCSQVQLLLMALFSSMLLGEVSGVPPGEKLTEILRTEVANSKVSSSHLRFKEIFRFLEVTIGVCLFQGHTRLLLLKFVSALMAAKRVERLNQLQEEEEEVVGIRKEMTQRQIPFSQRERKAGCRNFFWKTFTAC